MTKRQQQAMTIFMGGPYQAPGYKPVVGKYSAEAAAAIVGGLTGESGVNLNSTVNRARPDASGGRTGADASGGIAEWLNEVPAAGRKAKMIAYVTGRGKPADDFESQCWYVMYELENFYLKVAAILKNPGDRSITTMCWDFVQGFEIPNMAVAHMDDVRVPAAIRTYNEFKAVQGAQTHVVVATGYGSLATFLAAMNGPSVVVLFLILIAAVHAIIALMVPKPKDGIEIPKLPLPVPIPVLARDLYRLKKEALKIALAEFAEAQKAFAKELEESSAELDDDPSVVVTLDHRATAPAPKLAEPKGTIT